MEGKAHGQFLSQLTRGRWMVVVASFYILSFSGVVYMFGIYSEAIKTALHYDQETIDTLGFFKDLGTNVGIISGLMNEVLPTWMVLAVGAGMNLFGYLMIWMAVTHRIACPPVWQMYLYLCIGANSQTFTNTGVLVTCVKNFPQSRGVVLGLLKGCIGLSGAILTQVYHALYGQDTRGVILLIGWLPSLVTLLFMFFVRPMKPEMDKRDGNKHFFSFLYLALLLAAFLMVIIIVENQLPFSSITYKCMGAISLLLVVSNVVIAVRAEHEIFEQKAQDIASNGKVLQIYSTPKKHLLVENQLEDDAPSLVTNSGVPSDDKARPNAQAAALNDSSSFLASRSPANFSISQGGSGEGNDIVNEHSESQQTTKTMSSTPGPDLPSVKGEPQHHNKIEVPAGAKPNMLIARFKLFFRNWPERGDDFTILQAILSLDMWILFTATTCGVGATLTAIDNMGQIGASLGYSTVRISTFVSLISIWNFLGRVVAGFASELLLQRYRFPRTLMLTIVLGLACVGHLLIAFPAPGSLYIASIIVGLCFGAQWPVLFAVISELFGLKYYATLYNVGVMASPLGSYLMNVRVAGYLYDREVRRQQATAMASAALLSGGGGWAHAPAPMSSSSSSSSSIGSSSEPACNGPECFRLTFLIMAMVSAFGSFVSALLVLRTRKFYRQDLYVKFHHVNK